MQGRRKGNCHCRAKGVPDSGKPITELVYHSQVKKASKNGRKLPPVRLDKDTNFRLWGGVMYRQKTYRCGKAVYIEKTQTRIYRKGEARSPRRKPTPEEKREENARAAERKLARKIASNFDENDFFVTLTNRAGDRPTPEEAKDRLKKFRDEMRAEYRKLGNEFKYIIVTEYKNKSIHHHAVINGIPETIQLVRKHWPYGRPDFKPLDESGEYSELAAYLIKETEKTFREPDSVQKQRYTCSRNLIIPQPEIKQVTAKTFRKEPRAWKGYEILKESVVQGISKVTGYMYQYYTMIRSKNGTAQNRKNSEKKE